MNIWQFCEEEVARQGHTPPSTEWQHRSAWMRGAWALAGRWSVERKPTVMDVVTLGHIIEPHKNDPDEFRRGWVRVGGEVKADPEKVPGLMDEWVRELPNMEPDRAYLRFENIHPFIDGNGRVGKILHNWLGGTLDEPVLVQDFFGWGVP